MDELDIEYHREYASVLPLPIWRLYSRAHNAKSARDRHDLAYFLGEALVKLGASVLMAWYVEESGDGGPRDSKLDTLLQTLERPVSLGQWMGLLREFSRWFGERGDAHPLHGAWDALTRPHADLPGLLKLYNRIANGPDGRPSDKRSCRLLDVLDAWVTYRNGVIGHGGPRMESFYADEMGPRLWPAVNELLRPDVWRLLGAEGARLIAVRGVSATPHPDHWRVEVDELTGAEATRQPDREYTDAQRARLTVGSVAVERGEAGDPLELEPFLLLRTRDDQDDVLFLNAPHGKSRVGYLSYVTGATLPDVDMVPRLAKLLKSIPRGTQPDLSENRIPLDEPADGTWWGDFEVLGLIGRGGMGEVYLARQGSLGRLVAIKTLPRERAGDTASEKRFEAEIRNLAKCDHPNVVKVLTGGELPDGRPFYAMEYVPGCDLEQVWKLVSEEAGPTAPSSSLGGRTLAGAVLMATRARRDELERTRHGGRGPEGPVATTPDGPHETLLLPTLPEPTDWDDKAGGYIRLVATLGRDAALALAEVHARGIQAHRDVKPANLMLAPEGPRVVLMDFGLAKSASMGLTLPGEKGFQGTLRYSAPEQLASATAKIGPTVDVRALGLVLWELLARRRVFNHAQDENALSQCVLHEDPAPLRTIDRGIPVDLEAIVAKAVERNPNDRIRSARLMAELLTDFLEDRPIPLRLPSTVERVRRWARRKPGLVLAALLVLASVIGAIAVVRVEGLRRARFESANRAASDWLKRRDFSAESLQALDDIVPVLTETALLDSTRARVADGWATALRDRIEKPNPLEAELDDLAGELTRYESSKWADRKLLEELTARLGARRSDWVAVVRWPKEGTDLRATFPGLASPASEPARLAAPSAEEPAFVSGTLELSRNSRAILGIAPGWETAREIGVALHVVDGGGYRFVLSSRLSGGTFAEDWTPGWNLGRMASETGAVKARIVRGGEAPLALFEKPVRVDTHKGIVIEATREGNDLALSVGGVLVGTFTEAFPLGDTRGHVALLLDGEAGIERFEAFERPLPQSPSVLQQGDERSAAGDWRGALERYEAAGTKSGEARFKAACCRLELAEGVDTALDGLYALAKERGERWGPAAFARLFDHTHTHDGPEKAKSMLDDFQPDDRLLADLVRSVSHDKRTEMLSWFRQETDYSNIALNIDPVGNLEIALRLEAVLESDPAQRLATRWRHADALRVEGGAENLDRALTELQELFRLPDLSTDDRVGIARDLVWMHLVAGDFEAAKTVVRQWTARDHDQPAILVEQARIATREARHDEALIHLDQWLQTKTPANTSYGEWADACLVRGFTLDAAGSAAEAERSFRMATWPYWDEKRSGHSETAVRPNGASNGRQLREDAWGMTLRAMSASLSGILTDPQNGIGEARAIVYDHLSGTKKRQSKVVDQARRIVESAVPPELQRDGLLAIYRDGTGRTVARQHVLRELEIFDHFLQPFHETVLAFIRVGAFDGQLPDGFEPVVRDWFGLMLDYGREDSDALLHVLGGWKGNLSGVICWSGLRKILVDGTADQDPATARAGRNGAAAAAFVFGARRRQVGEFDKARLFFEAALELADEGSVVKRLCSEALSRLPK
jgi:serine/threonine protein kinase/tetratricopeptide (TPR) repeat protein